MGRHLKSRPATLLLFFLLPILCSCTSQFQNVTSASSASTDIHSYVSKISTEFEAGGLSASEASLITASIQAELEAEAASGIHRQSVAASNSALEKLPIVIRGAMKALGQDAFANDTKKLKAIDLISSKILLVFKDDLKLESPEVIRTLVQQVMEEQIKTSSHSQISPSLREEAYSRMIKEAMRSTEGLSSSHTTQQGLVGNLAEGAIAVLDEAGLDSTAIQAVVPKIVSGALTGLSNLTTPTAAERSDYAVEFITEVFANLLNAGLTTTQGKSLSSNIQSEVSSVVAADTTLPASSVTRINEAVEDGKDCSASSKWVYMFEYTDSSCQNLSRQYLDGPIENSPLNMGFPNRAFCYLNPANGKYYNWVGGPMGCSSQAPSTTTFPTRPSPRNLASTVAFQSGYSCSWGLAGGGGLANQTTNQEFCESNALLNATENNLDFLQVKFQGAITSTWDTAPAGVTFPNYSQVCTVTDAPLGPAMHMAWKRGERECISFCDSIVAEDPTSSYGCELESVLIKSY